jgi:hypothetical protein
MLSDRMQTRESIAAVAIAVCASGQPRLLVILVAVPRLSCRYACLSARAICSSENRFRFTASCLPQVQNARKIAFNMDRFVGSGSPREQRSLYLAGPKYPPGHIDGTPRRSQSDFAGAVRGAGGTMIALNAVTSDHCLWMETLIPLRSKSSWSPSCLPSSVRITPLALRIWRARTPAPTATPAPSAV